MTQGELFPLPGGEPPRPKPVVYGRITYTRFTSRRWCGDCTWLIHEYGQGGAPLPNTARWRRKDDKGITYLCHEHTYERQEAGE